jgi:outer membrane immunogenic protein
MTAKIRLLTATLFAIAGSLPVMAGGPIAIAEEPTVAAEAEVQDWKGLHFGLVAAKPYGESFWAERRFSAQSTPDDFSGTLPTLSAGYDWQRGKLVYGVTLGVSTGEMTAQPTNGSGFGCDGCETTVDKLVTLRGRVGWSLGKTLIYATAGAARADVIGTFQVTSVIGQGTLTGWTAGIGVERFVGKKITLSAEYLQTDLGRMELPFLCGVNCYTDVEFGLLQLGVNYRW